MVTSLFFLRGKPLLPPRVKPIVSHVTHWIESDYLYFLLKLYTGVSDLFSHPYEHPFE